MRYRRGWLAFLCIAAASAAGWADGTPSAPPTIAVADLPEPHGWPARIVADELEVRWTGIAPCATEWPHPGDQARRGSPGEAAADATAARRQSS